MAQVDQAGHGEDAALVVVGRLRTGDDPPRRLVQTFTALWSDEVKGEGASRVTWEIEPVGDDSCRLTVTHDQLKPGANGELYGGWPQILSGLKTLLETGEHPAKLKDLVTTPAGCTIDGILELEDGGLRVTVRRFVIVP